MRKNGISVFKFWTKRSKKPGLILVLEGLYGLSMGAYSFLHYFFFSISTTSTTHSSVTGLDVIQSNLTQVI